MVRHFYLEKKKKKKKISCSFTESASVRVVEGYIEGLHLQYYIFNEIRSSLTPLTVDLTKEVNNGMCLTSHHIQKSFTCGKISFYLC